MSRHSAPQYQKSRGDGDGGYIAGADEIGDGKFDGIQDAGLILALSTQRAFNTAKQPIQV